jgi:pimeloyl-ACP methyl ester carboxylesterase
MLSAYPQDGFGIAGGAGASPIPASKGEMEMAEQPTVSESLAGFVTRGEAPPKAGSAASAFHDPRTFVDHAFPEKSVDLGEVTMNYVQVGSPASPALLLIPGQTESWWGYEKAIEILSQDFEVFAVDLRGQGRSSWTPGRYTLDNMGNDLVRFIAKVIGRPVVTSGCSSGGLLSAWLSAYALPGQLRGAVWEDPPLWASLPSPLYGPSIKQCIGPLFHLQSTYLGDQWKVGNWEGLRQAMPQHSSPLMKMIQLPPEPPQNLREYDPEWGRAFWEGTVSASLPHEVMLSQVKVPVLLTHHSRMVIPDSGILLGALTDQQAAKAVEIVTAAGQAIEYLSLPDAMHAMHNTEPARFANAVTDWAAKLPA